MQEEGALVLFAELFVAFAGFTGLAGVLTRSAEGPADFSQELRLLVEYSLFYVVLAVLPLVLWHTGLAEATAWRLACAVSALESTFYYVFRFSSLRAWSSASGNSGRFWTTVLAEWVLIVVLILAALQLAPIPASNIYVFHLLLGLVGTALSFAALVRPIWQEVRDNAA